MLALLEPDRIRRQRHVAAPGQLQGVRLLRIPGQARRLALPQMEFAVVLVDAEDGGMGAGRVGKEQVGVHPVPALHRRS